MRLLVSVLACVVLVAASDVCVLGAGAGGMYTAMRLKDLGKKVTVFEKEDRVGGNCDTFFGSNGIHVPLGVVLYPNIPVVTDLLDRFQLPYGPFPLEAFQNRADVDLDTGIPVDIYTPTPEEFQASFQNLYALYELYPYLKEDGASWPSPVPDELLLPYGEFQELYGLQGLWTFYRSVASLDILNSPAYYQLKYLRENVITLLTNSSNSIMIYSHCDSIYDSIAAYLGEENVKTGVEVEEVERRGRGPVTITYSDADGEEYEEYCGKVVVGFRPLIDDMDAFELSPREKRLFKKLSATYYPTGAFEAQAYAQVPPLTWNAKESTPYNTIAGPDTLLAQVSAFNTTTFKVYINMQGTSSTPMTCPLTDAEVEAMFKADLDKIPGIVPGSGVTLAIKQHAFGALPSDRAVKRGWFKKMNRLQGRKSTYYVGATMSFESQFDIWIHADEIANRILQDW